MKDECLALWIGYGRVAMDQTAQAVFFAIQMKRESKGGVAGISVASLSASGVFNLTPT